MKNNKLITLYVLFSALFFATLHARADQYRSIVYTPIYTVDPITSIENTKTYTNDGVASAIAASQHSFYWGTKSWQGSIGVGAFDNDTAFSFGLAKRFNKTLINSSISNEDGKIGGGIGINWLF